MQPTFQNHPQQQQQQQPLHHQQQQQIRVEPVNAPYYGGANSPSGGPGGYQSHVQTTTHHHDSLPRSSTPQQLQQQSGNPSLSELDSLLEDLSNSRYGNSTIEKRDVYNNSYNGINNSLVDSTKRPSVDSLLDELSNAHNVGPVYAVPNG